MTEQTSKLTFGTTELSLDNGETHKFTHKNGTKHEYSLDVESGLIKSVVKATNGNVSTSKNAVFSICNINNTKDE